MNTVNWGHTTEKWKFLPRICPKKIYQSTSRMQNAAMCLKLN